MLHGKPGMGKSQILLYLGKPKWMPKWAWRAFNYNKVVDIRVGNNPDDYYPLPTTTPTKGENNA